MNPIAPKPHAVAMRVQRLAEAAPGPQAVVGADPSAVGPGTGSHPLRLSIGTSFESR